MHTRRRVSWGLVAVLISTAHGVAADAPSRTEPGQCWWPAIEVVLASSTGSPLPAGNLGQAIDFLEVNTGIKSDGVQVNFVGYLVDQKKLRRTVERWTKWFLENYAFLYWDPARRVYLVDEQARSSGTPTTHLRGPTDGGCQPVQPTCEEVFGPDWPICKAVEGSHGA
jgi:hypothetical protein